MKNNPGMLRVIFYLRQVGYWYIIMEGELLQVYEE
jgi:hypothetical protein